MYPWQVCQLKRQYIHGNLASYNGNDPLAIQPIKTAIYSWQFSKKDYSWSRELEEFYRDIEKNRQPNPGLEQAYSVLNVIKKIYKTNKYYDYSA
jgi:predicted dehydrogenase